MKQSAAQAMWWFVSWWFCSLMGLFGFSVALRWLLHTSHNIRRRLTALIDLAWTSTSAASIAVALLAFGQLVWKDYSDQYDAATRASWDELAELDGATLLALNCPGGRPIEEAKLELTRVAGRADSACFVASRVAYWRNQVDERGTEVARSCPSSDKHYISRDYSTSTLVTPRASCGSSNKDTDCMRARCAQENAVLRIMLDIDGIEARLHADASLNRYQAATKTIAQMPMRDVYKSVRPFEPTPFFALLPIWAMIFGARLARPLAEILDPGSVGGGLRRALVSSWSDFKNWRPVTRVRRKLGVLLRRRNSSRKRSPDQAAQRAPR